MFGFYNLNFGLDSYFKLVLLKAPFVCSESEPVILVLEVLSEIILFYNNKVPHL